MNRCKMNDKSSSNVNDKSRGKVSDRGGES